MMIHMQVAPAEPLGIWHLSKYRMRGPIEIPLRIREPGNRSQQRFVVELKFRGLGATGELIHLRPRWNALRPWEWRIERDPFHHSPLKWPGSRTHLLLAHDCEERIVQMAHHLMRVHSSPERSAIGLNLGQAFQNVLFVG